jgi:hypothetical protein
LLRDDQRNARTDPTPAGKQWKLAMKIYVLMVLIGAIVASTKVYRQNLLKAERQ